jgi:hypothetical protein
MKSRFLLGVTLAAVVVCGCTWLLVRERNALPQQQAGGGSPLARDSGELQPVQQGPGEVVTEPNPSTTTTEPPTVAPAPAQTAKDASTVRDATPAPAPARPAQRQRTTAGAADAPQPLVPKPIARTALSYVGADQDAEEVWVNAINDPNRSADERKDLIEDLNEDGFPDPKNITQDDLPLIVSRLMLIEELAPDAIDDVNAAAFAEAYKDLANMLDRLARN